LNAKSLERIADEASIVSYDVKPNLPLLGRKYGPQLAAIRKDLAALDPASVATAVLDGRTVAVAGVQLEPDEILLQVNDTPGYATASEAGYTVAITTEVTPELAAEGAAREVVRRIQEMRREAGFDLADRITTWYQAAPALASVIDSFADYIQAETLSTALIAGEPVEGAHRAEQEVDGEPVVFAVQRQE
jgi:isoleucyl-tRNA synthetase